jgi:hypothetical protein
VPSTYNWKFKLDSSSWCILHSVFAALHALGKIIDGNGIDTCAIESALYTATALSEIFGGRLEYHITTCLAILMMNFDTISYTVNCEVASYHCSAALLWAIHSRNADMLNIFENIQSFCGSMVKYFFARDLLNNARLMHVHLALHKQEDPDTWMALTAGNFVVSKSEVPFTQLDTEQILEQAIQGLKCIVGLSQDEHALVTRDYRIPNSHTSGTVPQCIPKFLPVCEAP